MLFQLWSEKVIGKGQLFNILVLVLSRTSILGLSVAQLSQLLQLRLGQSCDNKTVTPKLNCVGLAGLVLLATTGCGPSIRSIGTVEKFQGQAINGDGKALANVLVVLQPTERGYEIELESNAEGKFNGEGIPGKYMYYFAESKTGKHKLPKGIPSNYLEPKLEHLVSVQSNEEIMCKVE